MKKFVTTLLLTLTLLLNLSAQQTLPCTTIEVQDLNSQQPYITGTCLEVSSNLHIAAKNVLMEADQRIHFAPGSKISPNQNGHFQASIRPNAMEVVWMEPGNTWSVGKYEKLELGVRVPSDIQNEIYAFLNSGSSAIDPLHPGINPFNPEEISVEAEFNYAAGQAPFWFYLLQETSRKIYGFWFQDYSRVELTEQYTEHPTDYHFRVRFAPPLVGQWDCVIKMYVNGVLEKETQPFSFNVSASNNPGYVKVGDSKRFFTLGDDFFFPIGMNLPHPSCHGAADCDVSYFDPNNHPNITDQNTFSEGYKRFYQISPLIYDFYKHDILNVKNSGGNTIRNLMFAWGNDIEFEALNNYATHEWHDPVSGLSQITDYRARVAWEMDNIISFAETMKMKIMLNVLLQTSFLSCGDDGEDDCYHTYYDWIPGNSDGYIDDIGFCYNNELQLTGREDYLTDADAKKFFKYKLRYIVSRWGYSTAIMALQLNSEINGAFDVDGENSAQSYIHPLIEAWHAEMLAYLKELGIQQLSSVSYAGYPGIYAQDEPITSASDRSFYLADLSLPTYNHYNILPSRQEGVFDARKTWFPATEDEFDEIYQGGWSFSYYENNQMKPFMNGEIGSQGPDRYSLVCDQKAEWIRNTYITPFTGMAGMSLHWEANYDYDLWQAHFPNISAILAPYDFNEDGGWVAYHDFDEVHWENWQRKPGIVDLFYLRSPDEKRAVGVLGNRTYNFYTQWDNTKCGTFVWSDDSTMWQFERTTPPNNVTWDDQAYNNPKSAYYINESMQVDVKSKKTYVITYINPLTMQVVDSEEKYNLTGKLNLSFPYLTGNVDRPILLITVELKNKNRSTENYLDSVQHSMDQIALEFQEAGVSDFIDDKARIYPNPAEDYVIIELPLDGFCKIDLLSCTGNVVKSVDFSGLSYKLNISDIRGGLYVLQIEYNQKIETFKLVVQ